MLAEGAVMKVYVVKCEHFIDDGDPMPYSSRIDSVWPTWESAVEYLNGMTGDTMNGLGEWSVNVKPGPMEGDYASDVYTVEESEMHG